MGSVPTGSSVEFYVVVDDDTIVNDMEFRASGDFTFFVKDWAVECDVVGLPFAGFTAGINEGFGTTVEGSALTVRIGLVLVAVEHLNFILTHEKDAAVTASLTVAFDDGWGGKFDMQPARTEFFFALNVAAPTD